MPHPEEQRRRGMNQITSTDNGGTAEEQGSLVCGDTNKVKREEGNYQAIKDQHKSEMAKL